MCQNCKASNEAEVDSKLVVEIKKMRDDMMHLNEEIRYLHRMIYESRREFEYYYRGRPPMYDHSRYDLPPCPPPFSFF